MSNFVIGAELRLDGEKDFKRAVSSVNQDLKVLSSELKKTESEYKGNADSISGLTAKSEQFAKIAEAQRKKVEILHQAVEKSRERFTAAGENVEKYRKELADAQSELERMKSSSGATTEEIAEQEKTVAELSGKLEKAEKAYDAAEKSTKRWETSLNNAEAELNDTERELAETDKALREMGKGAKYSKEQIEAAESTLSDFGEKAAPVANAAKTAFKALAAVTAAAAGASAAVIKKSVDIGGEFESQMSKVQAISGAAGADLDALREKAKEMGGTTKFTATQAGQALEYMAMAGWETADMLDGIEGIMNLAAAAGEDLGTTSDIVTDALTAFGMQAGEAGHFADVLAAASSNANTNVSMMGETFKYVGAMAGTLGYSAEDVGLSIGLMANAGIKASQAGTELNAIYTRLSVNTSHARDAIGNLGISFYDSNGKARAWGTILDEMRQKTVNMTDAEKTAFANRVAGQRAQAGLLAMLNATTEDYSKLTKSINSCDGAAKHMADTMQNNLQGQLTILKSGLEGAAISIYDEMQKPLTEGVKTIISTLNDPRIQSGIKTIGKQFGDMFSGVAQFAAKHAPDFIRGFQKLTNYLSGSSFKSTVKSVVELIGDIGKTALEIGKVAIPVVTTGLELLAKSGKILIPVLTAAYAGFKAFQIVKTVTTLIEGAGAAFEALNVIMMANPWALVAGAITAVTIAIVGFSATCGEAEDKYKSLDDQIEETAESMRDMAQARKDAYDSEYAEIYQVESLRDKLRKLVDSNGKLIGKKEELQAVTAALNEKGFKVEMNKTGDLIKNYKDLNKQITDYIASKQYEAKMSALDSEYKKYSVDKSKYHDKTKQAQAAYEAEIAEFKRHNYYGLEFDPSKFFDRQGNATDYYRETEKRMYSSYMGTVKESDFLNMAKQLQQRAKAVEKAAAAEGKALKLIDAVEKAYLLGNQGKYAEANKALQSYFDERDATFKRAEQYQSNQRKKAISDLSDQLLEEIEMHKTYLDTGSKEMIDASIGYIEQAADELGKVGIKIPDGIIEGLKNGTLSVDDAMKQIQEIIRNGGEVDLTEEGQNSVQTYINGVNAGKPAAEEAGQELAGSTLKPLKGAATGAETAGTDTAGGFIGPIYHASGAAENAGQGLAGSALKPLKGAAGGAETAGANTAGGFIGPIYHASGEAETAGRKAGNAAVNGMSAATGKARSAGESIGRAFGAGIPVGIREKIGQIKQSAVSTVNVAMEAARKAADVNSPSKKTRDLVGKPLAEGVAVGMEKGVPDAARRAAAATSAIISRMQAATSAATAKINGAGSFTENRGGNVNKTININYRNQFTGASARDGEALLRQLDRALGANL